MRWRCFPASPRGFRPGHTTRAPGFPRLRRNIPYGELGLIGFPRPREQSRGYIGCAETSPTGKIVRILFGINPVVCPKRELRGRRERPYCRMRGGAASRTPLWAAGTPSVHPWTGIALLRRRGRRRYTHGRASPFFDGGDAVGTPMGGHRPSSTAGTPSVHPWTGIALLRRRGRRRYTHGRVSPFFDGGDAVGTTMDGHRPSSTAGTPSVHPWTGIAQG